MHETIVATEVDICLTMHKHECKLLYIINNLDNDKNSAL